MVDLASLGVKAAKANQFAKRGVTCGEDLARYLPKKYDDFSKITGLLPAPEISVFVATVKSVRYKVSSKTDYIMMGLETEKGESVTLFWFNQHYMLDQYQSYSKKPVLVAGKAEYDDQYKNYSISSPLLCTPDIKEGLKIYPRYKKIPNMSQEYLEKHINLALSIPECTKETVAEEFLKASGQSLSVKEALMELHYPSSPERLAEAQERLKYDDLLYFALRLALANRNLPTISKYGITDNSYAKALLRSLPFSLTADQHAAIKGMTNHIKTGRRLNALLQADVGSGKTICAFLMMCLIISCGCQAAMVAPTRELAHQHYLNMKEQIEPLGISIAFYGDSKMKKAEKTEILSGLMSGEIQIVVGTHALFSPNVSFHSLGMVVIDEEHKFGVAQRKALTDRVSEGVHCITMSATPIPRSLALGLYGDNVQVFSILTRPSGRQPTKTVVFSEASAAIEAACAKKKNESWFPLVGSKSMERLDKFIRFQYASGHQTYVVCPAIESGDSDAMKEVVTIEQAQMWLSKFEAEGIKTEVLTGKTSKENSAQILQRFRANETNVLLATSVIEVGIDVPNATGILLMSAERFGLASLHQLRGRVGRGSAQGYCVLYGKDLDVNERIQVLSSTSDGFKIAEEDLRIRGTGDFLGTQQSGTNKYVTLMLSSPDEFERVKEIAEDSLSRGVVYPLLEQAVADFRAEEFT